MGKFNAIVYDVETGGLNANKNPIIQWASQTISLDDLSEISRIDTYVKPYNNLLITEGALKANGITYKQIESGIEGNELVELLCDEFSKAKSGRQKPILIGHNVQFDIEFLTYLFDFYKKDLSKYLHCGDIHILSPKKEDEVKTKEYAAFYCTMWLSRAKWANDETMPNFKLETCCAKAGVDLVDAHNAQNDVTATKELFIKLISDMRNGGNSISNEKGPFKEIRYRDKVKFEF